MSLREGRVARDQAGGGDEGRRVDIEARLVESSAVVDYTPCPGPRSCALRTKTSRLTYARQTLAPRIGGRSRSEELALRTRRWRRGSSHGGELPRTSDVEEVMRCAEHPSST